MQDLFFELPRILKSELFSSVDQAGHALRIMGIQWRVPLDIIVLGCTRGTKGVLSRTSMMARGANL